MVFRCRAAIGIFRAAAQQSLPTVKPGCRSTFSSFLLSCRSSLTSRTTLGTRHHSAMATKREIPMSEEGDVLAFLFPGQGSQVICRRGLPLPTL